MTDKDTSLTFAILAAIGSASSAEGAKKEGRTPEDPIGDVWAEGKAGFCIVHIGDTFSGICGPFPEPEAGAYVLRLEKYEPKSK